MSIERTERKSFPDEPAYNVGAAVGWLAGLAVDILATIDAIPLPGFCNNLSDWARKKAVSGRNPFPSRTRQV